LLSEIFLLEPKHLLVLGKSTNANSLRKNVIDRGSWDVICEEGEVTQVRAEIYGNPVTVWIVPHPAAWLKTERRAKVIDDLKTCLEH
jgi:uracil-DNA glycosylase